MGSKILFHLAAKAVLEVVKKMEIVSFLVRDTAVSNKILLKVFLDLGELYVQYWWIYLSTAFQNVCTFGQYNQPCKCEPSSPYFFQQVGFCDDFV